MSTALAVTQTNFKKEVLENQGLVLVDFWAPWCGPCQMLSPIIDEIAAEMGDKLKVVKINVDEENQIAMDYNVSAIPTVIIFKDGKVIDTLVGFKQKQDYLKLLTG